LVSAAVSDPPSAIDIEKTPANFQSRKVLQTNGAAGKKSDHQAIAE
jgi:hypothetical protein